MKNMTCQRLEYGRKLYCRVLKWNTGRRIGQLPQSLSLTWFLVRDILLSSDRRHTPIVVGKIKTWTSL